MGIALTITVTVAIGLLVGVLSGLLGIGGGLILVPTFKLYFALEAIVATATSLFTIIPTSIAGAITRIRNKTCIPKLGVAAGLGGAITSPIGVWLASISPGWLIMLATAIIIGYSAFKMLRKALAMKPGASAATHIGPAVPTASASSASLAEDDAAAAHASSAPSATSGVSRSDVAGFSMERRYVALAVAIGFAAGVASGYIGLGGGFLMVPLMVSLMGMPMKFASGTSLIAIVILAIPGVAYQGMLGNVSWLLGIAMAVGAVPGATLGAHLASRLPERLLRLVFGVMLLVAAVLLVLDELGLLG